MLRNTILVALVAFATAEKLTFDNYKVVRVIPASEEHLKVLDNLKEAEGYSYWKSPSRVFLPVDVMVAPNKVADLYSILDVADMVYETYVENVQHLIDHESPATFDGMDAAAGFGWTRYYKLEEIYDWLESLADKYPGKIEVIDAGKTYEGRVIKGVKLSFGANKPGVFVEGGIHAREWISPATVTYLLNEFLTSKDPDVRKMAEAYDWYMFPSFNPDGYVYTHTKNRFWRKTRSPSKGGSCIGTDANRNWDYKWMVAGGASSDPCSESFAGSAPFSEVEVKTMSEYIKSLGSKLFAYISFHSYSQLLLFPFGHTEEHLANYDESKAIGLKTIDALAKRYGTHYVTGNIAETIYVATGTSMDWVKANLDVPVAFTYELRDKGRHGFVLSPEQIIINGQEILDSFVAMFKEATRFGYPKPAQ